MSLDSECISMLLKNNLDCVQFQYRTGSSLLQFILLFFVLTGRSRAMRGVIGEAARNEGESSREETLPAPISPLFYH